MERRKCNSRDKTKVIFEYLRTQKTGDICTKEEEIDEGRRAE